MSYLYSAELHCRVPQYTKLHTNMNRTSTLLTLAVSLLAGAVTAATTNIGATWIDLDLGVSRTRASGFGSFDNKSISTTFNVPVAATMDLQITGGYAEHDIGFGIDASTSLLGAGLRFHGGTQDKVKPFAGIGIGVVRAEVFGFRENSVAGKVQVGVEISGNAGITTPYAEVTYVERYEAWAGTLAVEHMFPIADKFGLGLKAFYTREEQSTYTYGISLIGRAYF